jgi:hypothetical protein
MRLRDRRAEIARRPVRHYRGDKSVPVNIMESKTNLDCTHLPRLHLILISPSTPSRYLASLHVWADAESNFEPTVLDWISVSVLTVRTSGSPLFSF